MSSVSIPMTHEGWFMFCPIWIAYPDPNNDAPTVAAKYYLEWVFLFALSLHMAFQCVAQFLDLDVPGFALRVSPLDEVRVVRVPQASTDQKDRRP